MSDRGVEPLRIGVWRPDAFVVPPDDAGQFVRRIQIGALGDQPQAGGDMRLMRPFGARQASANQPLAQEANG